MDKELRKQVLSGQTLSYQCYFLSLILLSFHVYVWKLLQRTLSMKWLLESRADNSMSCLWLSPCFAVHCTGRGTEVVTCVIPVCQWQSPVQKSSAPPVSSNF